MLIQFWKYQGTGNNFVMLDNRQSLIQLSSDKIIHLCDRRFGIGADGLILLEMDEEIPRMVYYNSDGRQSTMCGNGGRCFVAFCHFLQVNLTSNDFLAVDGLHAFSVSGNIVSLQMKDVLGIENFGSDFFLDTGSPHYVQFVDDVASLDVNAKGKAIRYNDHFRASGVNVNFVKQENESIRVRTYERGVEGETFSCGTGVTAAVLAFDHKFHPRLEKVNVHTLGGDLAVSFKTNSHGTYTDIWLHGPAEQVYSGSINV
jgi:diaminopimelate epimerase